MIVSNVKTEDIKETVLLMEACYDEMEFNSVGYSFDKETVSKIMAQIIDGSGIGIKIIKDNRIVGVGFVLISPSFINKNNLMAFECAWHTDPMLDKYWRGKGMILLVDEMEKRIKEKGLKHIHMSASSKYPSIGKMLEQRGYTSEEVNYVKEL